MCARLSSGAPRLPRPNNFWLNIMGRLQPDTGTARAASELEILYHQGLLEQAPSMRPALLAMLQRRHITLAAGDKGMGGLRGQFGTPLVTLMAGVAPGLLIPCATAANPLPARASARRGESAARLAPVAPPPRLPPQITAQSLVLSTP